MVEYARTRLMSYSKRGHECRPERGQRADPRHHGQRGSSPGLEERAETNNHVHARRHHRRCVNQSGDWSWTLHGIGKPHVEGNLSALSCSASEQQQRTHGRERRSHRCCACVDLADTEASDLVRDQEDAEQEREVTDPVDDERLLRRRSGRLSFEPESDQQIGAQPHALPANEQQDEVVGQNENEHRRAEQIQVCKETRVSIVSVHVADGVDVDERPHPRHDEHHHDAQRIEKKLGVRLEVADGNPVEQLDDERALLALFAEHPEEQDQPAQEGKPNRCRSDVGGYLAQSLAEEHEEDRTRKRDADDGSGQKREPGWCVHRITTSRA